MKAMMMSLVVLAAAMPAWAQASDAPMATSQSTSATAPTVAPTSEPASEPAIAPRATPPTSAPAKVASAVPMPDKAITAILDRMEAAGQKYTTVQAQIDFTVDLKTTGESEVRTGSIAYQKETATVPGKFRVQFDTFRLSDQPKARKSLVVYAFDGQWFTTAKYDIKQMTRQQWAAAGERVPAFQLGKGPFPVPFGQKKADMLEQFNITMPAAGGKPETTDHIQLIPKAEHVEDHTFVKLDMWIDRTTDLPTKVASVERNKNVTTVVFKSIQTNQPLNAEMFNIPKPGRDWDYTVEEMRAKPRK